MLMFVALHEISHVMSVLHIQKNFWDNFRFILRDAWKLKSMKI